MQFEQIGSVCHGSGFSYMMVATAIVPDSCGKKSGRSGKRVVMFAEGSCDDLVQLVGRRENGSVVLNLEATRACYKATEHGTSK